MPTRRSTPRPGRRAVMVSAVLAALGGCTAERRRPAPTTDERVTARIVAGKRDVLAAYAATGARHPGLATRLAPLVAAHLAHLRSLGAAPTQPPTAAPTPAPVTVPARPAAALARLAERERAAAGRRLDDIAQVSPGLARLVASIGAAEAVHATLLGGPG